MTRPSTAVLASAARAARKRGMTAHEALTIVAREWGGIMGKHGEITGWQIPEDERVVRKVKATKTEEPTSGKESKDGEPK